jgi:HD-GYP domain-containing protein (c-di-GMP phosphodiesterase class II)
MRTHTVEGERMLQQVGGLLSSVGVVVRASHERWDGGGYPDGLAGDAIPVAARIVSACDAFNAMTTDRSYRKALPLEVAIGELHKHAGTQFAPDVVVALVAVVTRATPESPGWRLDIAPAEAPAAPAALPAPRAA